MRLLLLALGLTSTASLAQPSATVVSNGQLPACFESVQMRELYPRMKIKNACGFAVEVLWCWKAVPSGWINDNNSCKTTGFVSSGVLAPDSTYEFPDRPYLDSKFKPSAMLEVQKVCRVGNGPNAQACK